MIYNRHENLHRDFVTPQKPVQNYTLAEIKKCNLYEAEMIAEAQRLKDAPADKIADYHKISEESGKWGKPEMLRQKAIRAMKKLGRRDWFIGDLKARSKMHTEEAKLAIRAMRAAGDIECVVRQGDMRIWRFRHDMSKVG